MHSKSPTNPRIKRESLRESLDKKDGEEKKITKADIKIKEPLSKGSNYNLVEAIARSKTKKVINENPLRSNTKGSEKNLQDFSKTATRLHNSPTLR